MLHTRNSLLLRLSDPPDSFGGEPRLEFAQQPLVDAGEMPLPNQGSDANALCFPTIGQDYTSRVESRRQGKAGTNTKISMTGP
jgi:hypothetical protein